MQERALYGKFYSFARVCVYLVPFSFVGARSLATPCVHRMVFSFFCLHISRLFSVLVVSFRPALLVKLPTTYSSGGNRGADVKTLRGTKGADFEGYARIQRGGGRDAIGAVVCGCFGGGGGSAKKESNKERLVLIKGPFCFVFKNEQAASPKYAISLQSMKAASKSSNTHMVMLETSLGDTEYEFTFQNEDAAKRFRSAVKEQAAVAQTEQIRKRLGHEHLLNKRSSIRYAESIATKKIDDQPSAPLKVDEVMMNMPDPAL